MKKKLLIFISIIVVTSIILSSLVLLNNFRSLSVNVLVSSNENGLIIKNNVAIFEVNTNVYDIEEITDMEVQVFDGESEIDKLVSIKTNELLKINNDTYLIAVLGDVKADGLINVQDIARSYAALSKTQYNSLSDAEKVALDVNCDDKKNVLDLLSIYKEIGKEDDNTITIDKESISINTGETDTLVATIIDEDLEDKTITWESSNENIAIVDQNGLVTGVANGTTSIKAIASNGKFVRCIVTVNATPRQTIAKPYLDVDTYTYTGEVIAPSIYSFDSSVMGISGTTNTINAGIYEMTISIKDKEQYMWEDNSDDDITLGWVINKATREAPTVTDYFGIYDGNPHTISVLEQDTEYSTNGEVWDTTIPTRTKVGETTVYVRIMEDSNHYPSNPSTGKITITDATIEIPTSDMCEDITYNGLEQIITKTPSGGYTFSNNVQTNSGIYVVDANIDEGFKWEDNTTETKQITCDIKKVKLTKPTIETTMYVYTGSTITPTITGYDSNTMNIEGVQSSVAAGTYHIMISLKDKTNTEWNDNTDNDIDLSWDINKATRDDPTVTNYIGYYDGNPHTISVVESGVEYSLDEELWVNVAPTRTEIGETTVYVRIREDGNHYASSTITSIIQINPIEIQIPTSDMCENITYNGLEQTITKTASEGYTFSNNTKVYAGIYDVDANLNAGYIWNDNTTETKKIPCEIKKLKLTIPTMDVSEYTYTGETITPTITGYDNNTMSIEGTTSAKNEGSYTITIGIKDKDNTKWMDDTNQDITLYWDIINPTVNKLTINPNGGSYNGTTSSTEIIEETGTKYSVQNNLTRTGYTFTGFKFTGVGTYSLRDSSKIILTGDDANYLSRGYFKYRTSSDTKPSVYNKLDNDSVSLAIVEDSTNSDYGYSLKIKSIGEANPGIGGFSVTGTDSNHALIKPDDNKSHVDVVRVRAKVPQNYNIKLANVSTNYTGYGSKYIYQENAGTGDWVNYYFYIYTGNGNSGDFKDKLFVYIDGEDASPSNEVIWYVDSVVSYTYNKDDFYSVYKFAEGAGKLTAQWQASGSRITFDPNGGTISGNAYANFTYNEIYDDQKVAPYNINNTDYTVYREGYTFKGWYTSKVNDVQVFDANGSLNESISGYSSSDKTWIKSNNKTLYAQWEEVEPTGLTLNKTSISLNNAGKTEIITPTVTPSTANQNVTWTSNNESVATVDENGKVIAMGTGTAKITATTSNGISKKCTVTVTERTNVGIWYSTWYSNEEGYTIEQCAIDEQKKSDGEGYGCAPHNFWFKHNIGYLPYLSTKTFGYHDTYDESEIRFHLREIGNQDIDFLIFDQTNNIHVDGGFIYERTMAAVRYLNDFNLKHQKIYYVNAVGGNQWQKTTETKASITETEAKDIWNDFVMDAELGQYQYYYNDKPILVIFGGHEMKSIVENYINNNPGSYLEKYSLFYADNSNTPGYWGWSPTTPVQSDKAMVVMPGWRNENGNPPVIRQKQPSINIDDGDTYRLYWNAVINRDNYPEFVIINSFNEYAERTAIWITDTSQVTPEVDKWSSPNLYWEINRFYMNYLRTHE